MSDNPNKSHKQHQKAVQELIDAGFTIDEANEAIAMSINQNESKTEQTRQTEHACICGKNLLKMDASLCYSKGVNCNMCKNTYSENHHIYHCVHQSHKHRNGFDICSNCIDSYAPKQYIKTVITPQIIQRLVKAQTMKQNTISIKPTTVRCINVHQKHSSILAQQFNQLLITDNPSAESFIISNSAQLIILMRFESAFDINSVHLITLKQTIPYIGDIQIQSNDNKKKPTATDNISGSLSAPHPKYCHMFRIDGVDLAEDINEFKLLQLFVPQARINGTSMTLKDENKGLQNSMFKMSNAKSVKQLAIYIEANHGTERTYLNAIKIKGIQRSVVVSSATSSQSARLDEKNNELNEEEKLVEISATNEKNNKLFASLLEQYKDVPIKRKSSFTVETALAVNRRFSQKLHDCDLNNCPHLLRLKKILSKYNQFVSEHECKLSDDETETVTVADRADMDKHDAVYEHHVEPETFHEIEHKDQAVIIEQEVNENDITFLMKIFKTIRNNPNNKKYQNLNAEKVILKFSNPEICKQILVNAGFNEQEKDKRLIFDQSKLETLKATHANLKQKLDRLHSTKHPAIISNSEITPADHKNLPSIRSKMDEINAMLQNNPKFKSLLINPTEDPLQTQINLNSDDSALRELVDAVSQQLFNSPRDKIVNKILGQRGLLTNDSVMQQIRMKRMSKDLNSTKASYASQIDTILKRTSRMDSNRIDSAHTNHTMFDEPINDTIELPVNQHQNIEDIYDYDYDNTDLLNDFHHLLSNHDNQFEDIHNGLTEHKECNALNCFMLRRNRRNRASSSNNSRRIRKIYFNLDDKYDLVQQQLLDKIHCHYHHSFDTGHRMNRAEIQRIKTVLDKDNDNELNDKVISEVAKINQEKKKIFNQNIDIKTSKFSTTVDEETINYSNGIRYFYWNHYKTSHLTTVDRASWMNTMTGKHANEGYSLADWYIARAFKHLKEEAIHNKIYSLNRAQWDTLVLKAYSHFNTAHSKRIHCQHPHSQSHYGIKQKAPIHLAHLVAMLLYCNYDDLQRAFTETYRRIPVNESDESLKRRHANYGNLGRLLRECVECYGANQAYSDTPCVYHGITIKANFSASIICFKGPVSTSTDYVVAAKFCANRGLILHLHLDAYWSVHANYFKNKGIAMFDCEWLSDYPQERERFFIGGFANFTMSSIVMAAEGVNYGAYIHALNKIFVAIRKDASKNNKVWAKFESEYEKDTIDAICFRLLSDLLHTHYPNNSQYHSFNSLPEYVRKLVRSHFAVVSNLCLFNKRFRLKRNDTILEKIMRMFFWYDFGWINLEKMNKVFPALKYMEVRAESYEFVLNDSTYLSILSHLKRKRDTKLQRVVIKIAKQANVVQKVKDICSKFEVRFNRLMFTLRVIESSDDAKIDIRSETTDLKSNFLKVLGSQIPK